MEKGGGLHISGTEIWPNHKLHLTSKWWPALASAAIHERVFLNLLYEIELGEGLVNRLPEYLHLFNYTKQFILNL